jgi:ribosome-associated toxin RatA of RatAB toxin-antitoxin module
MMKIYFLSTLIFISTSVYAAFADLRPVQLSELKTGKIIKKIVELDNEVWPQVTIIGLIPFSPEQNVKVFTEFETHKDFIPDIIRSKVVKQISAEEKWIEYKMKMPWPVEDSEYITSNVVKREGENFRISWHLIKANQMKATTGTVLFEAYEGKTLMTYTSHITPDSSLAGMFTGRVAKDVEKTFHIITQHLQQTLATRSQGAMQ